MYPYEITDSVIIKENFANYFLYRAMKELKFFVKNDDFGFEHDTETDDMYIFVDGTYDSLVFNSDNRLFQLCDTSCFKETDEYENVYQNFLNEIKRFLDSNS